MKDKQTLNYILLALIAILMFGVIIQSEHPELIEPRVPIALSFVLILLALIVRFRAQKSYNSISKIQNKPKEEKNSSIDFMAMPWYGLVGFLVLFIGMCIFQSHPTNAVFPIYFWVILFVAGISILLSFYSKKGPQILRNDQVLNPIVALIIIAIFGLFLLGILGALVWETFRHI